MKAQAKQTVNRTDNQTVSRPFKQLEAEADVRTTSLASSRSGASKVKAEIANWESEADRIHAYHHHRNAAAHHDREAAWHRREAEWHRAEMERLGGGA